MLTKMILAFSLLLMAGCETEQAAPPPPVTEHLGPGVVRTVEYWTEGTDHNISRNRLVIETANHEVRQYEHLCEQRVAAWQGLEFKDMVFQYNPEWTCTHIIEFKR